MTQGEPGTRGQVSDARIHAALQGWISKGQVPVNNANTLYFIYTPPNVTVSSPEGSSCGVFCGYHGVFGSNIYYAVIPYVNCGGCEFSGSFLDTLTGVSSHELAEAITDPSLQTWWVPNSGQEIGDICNRQTVRLGGYLVQTEWSNSQGACVIAPRVQLPTAPVPDVVGFATDTPGPHPVAQNAVTVLKAAGFNPVFEQGTKGPRVTRQNPPGDFAAVVGSNVTLWRGTIVP